VNYGFVFLCLRLDEAQVSVTNAKKGATEKLNLWSGLPGWPFLGQISELWPPFQVVWLRKFYLAFWPHLKFVGLKKFGWPFGSFLDFLRWKSFLWRKLLLLHFFPWHFNCKFSWQMLW